MIQCPHCRSQCQANDEYAGQQVRCPTCRNIIAVPPNPLTGAAPSVSDFLGSGSAAPSPSRPTSRKRKTRRKKDSSDNVVIVLLGIAATLCLVCCGGMVALVVAPKIARSRLNETVNAEISSSVADTPDRPEWIADATLIARLGPEVTFGQHAMRLPTGFTPAPGHVAPEVLRTPGGGQARVWYWVGPVSHNRRRAVVIAEVREPPASMEGPKHFEQELPWEIRSARDKQTVHTLEAGRIGGKRAVRLTYFMPEGSLECVKIFRFEGNRQLVVNITCPNADRAEFFDLMQAAQLTVREISGSVEPPSPSDSPWKGPPIYMNQRDETAPIEGGTTIVGGASNPVFKEQAPDDGLLVGLEVGTEPSFGSQIVKTVRPIYRTAAGKEILGQRHGSEHTTLTSAKAKEGYAVGGISVKAGLFVDGFSIVFMRRKGNKLDPSDTYEVPGLAGRAAAPREGWAATVFR